MPQQAAGLLGTLIALAILIPLDAWVYLDARAHVAAGRPVVARIGSVILETPQQWLTGCAVALFLFLPAYITTRESLR